MSEICQICFKPEGNDPKAHNCVFSCGACGEFYEEHESDRDGFHLLSECSAYADEGYVTKRDQIIIDNVLSCGECGLLFSIAKGIVTINQGFIEFVCLPCKKEEIANA